MTSSGRRVKRRNLDECDDNAFRNNRSRKGKSGRKRSRRRSSKSKSSRPQRAAARNALHLFSKITGTPTDGEEDSFDGDSSDSESSLQESIVESDESGRDFQSDQQKYSKGKEVSLDESEDLKSHDFPETRINGVNRRRLIFKLPVRDPRPAPETTVLKNENQAELVASSSKSAQQTADVNGNSSSSKDPVYYSGSASYHTTERRGQVNSDRSEDPVDLFDGYMKGEIQWGVVRARTSRCLRVGEAVSSDANARSAIFHTDLNGEENSGADHEKEDKNFGPLSPLEIQNDEEQVHTLTEDNQNHVGNAAEPLNALENERDLGASSNVGEKDESLISAHVNAQDTSTASVIDSSRVDQLSEPCLAFPSVSTKVRSKRNSRDPDSPPKNETKASVLKISSSSTHGNDLNKEQNMVEATDDNSKEKSNQGENGAQEINAQVDKICTPHSSLEPSSNRDKMYKAVYRRSRSHRAVTSIVNGGGLGESTSNGSNINLNAAADHTNGTNEAAHTTGSLEVEPTTSDPNSGCNNLKVNQDHEYRSPQNGSSKRGQPTEEERGSGSKMTVGLRSTRSRRASYHHIRESSPINRKKSTQSTSKGSWLLLSTHEQGCRYIPQQGDEVVYLRQVS